MAPNSSEVQPSWWERLRSRQPKAGAKFRVNWLLLTLGIIFVAIAALMEHPVIEAITPDAVNVGHSAVFSWKAVIGLLKEVGFALIIAWAVSYLIERQAKKREHEAHEAARKQMASDVVHAVFGLQHPPEYVRKVVEVTLQPKVVRKHYSVSYALERLTTKEERDLGVSPGRFVKLTQISSYTFRNVSAMTVTHHIRYALPVRRGALYDFNGVVKARIGTDTFDRAAMMAKITSPKEAVYKCYNIDRTMKPGRELDVVFEAVSIKELSDTEVWGNAHATYEGMEMSIRNSVPDVTTFGIQAQTATEDEVVYFNEGQNAAWKIDGPILPNDSVVFWWRSSEDDGTVKPKARGRRKPVSALVAEGKTGTSAE